jgi:hypothetical protein
LLVNSERAADIPQGSFRGIFALDRRIREKGIDCMAQTLSAVSIRRRRIAPEAGRALEILGHAIDYLADEYIHRGGAITDHDPAFEAMQLLMERNREIYFSCPEVPRLRERFDSWWRFKSQSKT